MRPRLTTLPPDLVSPERRQVVGALAALAATGRAYGGEPAFPARPLTILAPANPGGGTDQIARLVQSAIIANGLSPRPIQVINRGGAAGAVGLADLVTKYHGNPYILMATGSSVISSTVAQQSSVRASDAEPIARLIVDELIVAVPAESRFANIWEFLDAFRRAPTSITWCGGSAGGVDHILVGMITQACNVPISELRYIAYAGGGAASAALLGGQVSVGVTGYSEWRGLAAAGRLRILASAASERFGDRTIPTLQEAGLDVHSHQWRGVFAAPGVQAEHLAWWASVIERMHASRIWREYLERTGWVDGYLAGDAFRKLVHVDQERYTRAVEHLGLTQSSNGGATIGPYAVPTAIAVAGAIALAATVIETAKSSSDRADPAPLAGDDEDSGGSQPLWGRFAAGAGLALAYGVGMAVVGFLVATPLFIIALGRLMRSKSLIRDTLAGIGLTAGAWFLFTRLLYVNLP